MAHASRLKIYRRLVQAAPHGLSAGELAQVLKVRAPTLSFHLKALLHAGLIKARHSGRFIYYSADFTAMNKLLSYLTENCCGGLPCDTRVKRGVERKA
ncbi:ArsR/SmtB family transcription factor [Candidatus Methylacidithermus pantelleriae]|uniref:ArsR/SmtB family transcription factor n=1 Tax=Candidatus Methylacidithermus pantelleriae TaxID=2744239 RepID=UPI001BD2BC98|nr:metalloregulator ArsR/SmtB family transcription factor [Candidatus Methylacidithermus pantelleriae]